MNLIYIFFQLNFLKFKNLIKDSQNNAAGGYNVADKFEEAATSEQDQHKAKYFQSGNVGKSKLMIEWWSQENFLNFL